MKRWYAVVYCNDDTIHLWKGNSKEECMDKLIRMMQDKRVFDRIVQTTIISRTCDDAFIFGNPYSLDMKVKFRKLLKHRKVEFKNG